MVTVNIGGTTWRPIFWVNVPIGLATLIAVPRLVPSTRSEHPATIDTGGTLLFAATLVALLVPQPVRPVPPGCGRGTACFAIRTIGILGVG